MRIVVRSSGGQGRNYELDVESSTKLGEVKKQLQDKIRDVNVQTMCLVFDGEQLDDDDTISDFDIITGSVLDLISPDIQSRHMSGFGLKFVDVSVNEGLKRMKWASQTVPRWRRARYGLCLEGPCKNSTCEAYNRMVIMPIGYKKFDMSSDPNVNTTKCPVCKEYVNPITCGFNNCWWRYDGTKDCENGPPQSCSSGWKRADDAYHRFDEQETGLTNWRKLILEAVKQRPSKTPGGPPDDSIRPETQATLLEESTTPESSQSLTTLSSSRLAAMTAALPPQEARHALNNNEVDVDWCARRDKFWCPWNSRSCTNELIIRGQVTIEIMQKTSVPFALQLSNNNDPHSNSAFSITLTIDNNHVTLNINNEESCKATNSLDCLLPDDGRWHRYWLSFYGQTGSIKYGIGEIRPLFAVFDINLPKNQIELAKQIQYLHVKVDNNDQMLTQLDHLKENFRFYLGKNPVLYDPPLFIVSNDVYDMKHSINHTAIPPSQLERPCRDLYDSIINFKLNDGDFPDLTRVIDESISNPNGWCHKKLVEKAARFGKANIKATYLRLTIGEREGNSPGHIFVVEVWPPGHYSPIHNHSNAYAIIRVLYGEILLKLYPTLKLDIHQYQPIEQICHEGQITWLLPNLNQTHQVKHVDLYGTCCVTIQCYSYGKEDREHYEFFDYLTNGGQSIGNFDPKSDMDFYEFKKLMREERRIYFH